MEPPIWGTTDVSSKLECSSSKERELRSVALEKTYVHDVYQQIACHFTDSRYRAWPRVKQFLNDLEPGSIICDVGCGNGKHLDINPWLFKIGIDRCSNLVNVTRGKGHEVLVSDNLALPLRDDCMDAVLSVAVIHHFATADRRIEALRELARVLRIGGKILVSVWAMEQQRHRKFESQDVLVPWNQPSHLMSSSDDKTSSIERDLNSTTTTSDDEATHYHAYTQTSDSDSFPSLSRDIRKRVRLRHRGKSIDPACSSQSSSDLSSPNESCYTFVRRAIQKLAGTKRNRGGRRPWFLQGLNVTDQDDLIEPLASMDEDVVEELKNTEPFISSDFSEFLKLGENNSMAQKSLIFSNLLNTRRRRTLETTRELQHPTSGQISAQPKSKSLSDLLGLIPIGFFRNRSPEKIETVRVSEIAEDNQSNSSLLRVDLDLLNDEVEFPECVSHKAVQTDESHVLSFNESFESRVSSIPGQSSKVTTSISTESHHSLGKATSCRPTLVKQKQSLSSPNQSLDISLDFGRDVVEDEDSTSYEKSSNPEVTGVTWGDIKTSVKNLPEFKSTNPIPQPPKAMAPLRVLTGSSLWKQTSLNEELIFSERLREKERLKQNIQKQCSLNEEFIHNHRENTRWDQMKEVFFNPSNVKCIQLLKNGISSRFRSYETPSNSSTTTTAFPRIPSPVKPTIQTNSIRTGFARMLQNWKQQGDTNSSQSVFLSERPKDPPTRRGLFPPFFLRRSSAGSLNVVNKDLSETTSLKLLSPPPYLSRKPSENDLVHDGRSGKLVPGVRHVRKLSREDGSDSSKDSSFQSDTSVDSEDSFASVIFIPKGDGSGGNDNCFFGSETRANSTEQSPKSPGLRLSPPNQISMTPKSPSPLARRSPGVSPPRIELVNSAQSENGRKFVFDEYTTAQLSNIILPPQDKITTETIEVPILPVDETQMLPLEVTLAPPPIISIIPEPTPETTEGTASVISDKNPSNVDDQETLPRKKVEKIYVLRKPGILPQNKEEITRKLVRRSLPKGAVELYNPETDDADTSDSSSSSPNSLSSVVSVVNEEEAAAQRELRLIAESEELTVSIESEANPVETGSNPEVLIPKEEITSRESSVDGGGPFGSSSESLGSHSSPKSKRKITLARLSSTTDWLSSIPSVDVIGCRRNSIERRHPGEKILLGEVKKFQQKGHDAKWPACIIDESPPQTANEKSEQEEAILVTTELTEKLLEEMEEKDSLFDSVENLSSKQQPSRNPSIDSSLRMSSTCSIRGGDSFESYCSSAKSSLTNSSSNQPKPSFPSTSILCHDHAPRTLPSSSRRRRPESSKSSSAAGEDTEDSSVLTYHRYYHVFKEGELDRLIEKYVQNLHIISSYYDHANWCIIAEKVQVWTI